MDIIDGFTDENGKFVLSGADSCLEKYKCFHDPSSKKLISGKELIKLKKESDWSEDKRKIWLYFYRPYKNGNIIGKKQKKLILNKKSIVSNLENRKNTCSSLKFLFLFLTLLFFYLSLTIISVLIPITTILTSLYFFLEEKKIINNIDDFKNDIFILKKEINYLFQQQDEMKRNRETSYGINKLFWIDLKKLETEYTDKLFHEDSNQIKKDNRKFYKSIQQETKKYNEYQDYPTFPVIPSWGLLQQSQYLNENTRNYQSTGMKIAANDIEEKIATWRTSKQLTYNKPIFRLWYIQFLFFHEKNITVQSFYYDFITKKKYGENLEIYQYNHITNYSYADEDISYMNSDPLMKEINLPEKLTKNIFCDEVKTLSFSSASGSHYRCVIPDNDVINGLNEWLKSDEAKEKLTNEDENNLINIDEREELLTVIDRYEGLIATLAWQSFKELRDKVAEFALTENQYNKRKL